MLNKLFIKKFLLTVFVVLVIFSYATPALAFNPFTYVVNFFNDLFNPTVVEVVVPTTPAPVTPPPVIKVAVPGASGSQGIQGPVGPRGPAGPTGAQGPQGLQGPAGSSGAGSSLNTSSFISRSFFNDQVAAIYDSVNDTIHDLSDDVLHYTGATKDVNLSPYKLTAKYFNSSGYPTLSLPTGVAGDLSYDTTTNTYKYFNGTDWGPVGSIPDLSGLVPYTGATGDVNLGAHSLSAGLVAVKNLFSMDEADLTVGAGGALFSSAPVSSPIFLSTITAGTAPLSVVSDTVVTNLNADMLDGNHASAFQPAGSYLTAEIDPIAAHKDVANTWTQPQTHSAGILPSSGPAYNLGSAVAPWSYVYAYRIASGTGEQLQVSSSPNAAVADSTAGNSVSISGSNATAGTTNAGAAKGGDVWLSGGYAKRKTSGDANGGNIILQGGLPVGNGSWGYVALGNSSATDRFIFNPALYATESLDGTFTNVELTAARTWTFPDATGTVALTSDIHAEADTLASVVARGNTSGAISVTPISGVFAIKATAIPGSDAFEGFATNGDAFYGSATTGRGIAVSSTSQAGGSFESISGNGVFAKSQSGTAVYGWNAGGGGRAGDFLKGGGSTADDAQNTFAIARGTSAGAYNLSGDILYLSDYATKTSGTISGALVRGLVDSTARLWFNPRTVDGASAVAHMLDTSTALSTVGAKLLSLRNNGVEKFSVGYDGTITATPLVSCGGIQTNGSGTMSCTSDERLKDIHGDFSTGLSAIMQINPQQYSWKTDSGLYDGGINYYGFIAQNIEGAIPEAVNTNPAGYKQVNTTTILATTVNAIKEMNLNLEGIAGTVTPLPGSPSESFVAAFFGRMGTWLGDATNGVGDFFANRVHTKELCVAKADGTEFCANGDELEAMVGSGGGSVTPPTPTCVDPQVLINNVCTDPAPIVPVCTPPQTLVDNVCTDSTPTEPAPEPPAEPAP